MEIDSEPPLSDKIANLEKLVSDILGSSQIQNIAFLAKAVSHLQVLRDLINQREIEEYVSLSIFSQCQKRINWTNNTMRDRWRCIWCSWIRSELPHAFRGTRRDFPAKIHFLKLTPCGTRLDNTSKAMISKRCLMVAKIFKWTICRSLFYSITCLSIFEKLTHHFRNQS